LHAQSPTPEAFLALGIRQHDDGDFEAAVFTLDSVVLKLQGQPGRVRRVEAYSYLGAAYVGLHNEEAAKGKFREALKLDPALRLDPERFPPRVVKVFDTQVLALTAAKKKRGARAFLIAGGLGAAGAVGLAAQRDPVAEPTNNPPHANPSFSPQGTAIAGVTELRFLSGALDVDGGALTYRWDFGDGTTSTEAEPTHAFVSPGEFQVRLTVTDAKGVSASSTIAAKAGTVSGPWVGSDGSVWQAAQNEGGLVLSCVQGPLFECRSRDLCLGEPTLYEGAVMQARAFCLLGSAAGVAYQCCGEFDPQLRVMTAIDGWCRPWTQLNR
jgi:hypothetical protein